MTLNELQNGEKARITSIGEDSLASKLMEMGLFTGTQIEIKLTAPFGDPIAIETGFMMLAIRRSDAKNIVIERIGN